MEIGIDSFAAVNNPNHLPEHEVNVQSLNDLLNNAEFINKAPKNVVASNQKKMDDLSEQLNNLRNALERFTKKK